jgi:hypothetical protein
MAKEAGTCRIHPMTENRGWGSICSETLQMGCPNHFRGDFGLLSRTAEDRCFPVDGTGIGFVLNNEDGGFGHGRSMGSKKSMDQNRCANRFWKQETQIFNENQVLVDFLTEKRIFNP